MEPMPSHKQYPPELKERAGIRVARCTVERLIRELGFLGPAGAVPTR